jgi:hypothetical protein
MIDPEYIKFFSSLGVGGVLAGMIFFYSRKDSKKHEEDWIKKEVECEGREDKLIGVITKNTEGFERLCGAINKLSADISKAEELKLQQMQELLKSALSHKT